MCDFVPGELIITFPRDEPIRLIMDAWFRDHGEEISRYFYQEDCLRGEITRSQSGSGFEEHVFSP